MAQKRKRAPGGGRKPQGPTKKDSMLQARIPEELSAQLKQAAAQNGRSLSKEAHVRLQESFDLPAEMQRVWGTEEVRALAQLVSRVAGSVQRSIGADPFKNAGDLAWHRNPFAHAAVETAISILLAHYRPAGPIETPTDVKKRADWVPVEHAETVISPQGVGRSCAFSLLDQLKIMDRPPRKPAAGAHYGQSYYVLPKIREVLGDPNDE
jgi:Arc-like DNA binding domain